MPIFSLANSNCVLNLLKPKITGTSEPPTYLCLPSVTFGSFLWSRLLMSLQLRPIGLFFQTHVTLDHCKRSSLLSNRTSFVQYLHMNKMFFPLQKNCYSLIKVLHNFLDMF